MTKNTVRRKKRKNMKLRRTIRKTVAALIMIMAVIVAGLPVENLGTMQAQTTNTQKVDIQSIYVEYANSMTDVNGNKDKEDALVNSAGISDATEYDVSDKVDEYTTLKIKEDGNGATIHWEFEVAERGSNGRTGAVIVNHNGDSNLAENNNITIGERLYTDYFVITENQFKEAKKIFEQDEYIAVFATEKEEFQIEGNNYSISTINPSQYDESSSNWGNGVFESEGIQFKVEGKNEILTVALTSKMKKYSINSDGEVVTGSKDEYIDCPYIMTFVRKVGVKTKENYNIENCPNCGAVVKINDDGVCDYCSTYVVSGEYGWVLTDINMIDIL